MHQTLQKTYETEVLAKRAELFAGRNVMAIPRIEKVVLNARIKRGGAADEEAVARTLTRITGQKPVPGRARISISNFKIREGQVVGMRVTLRGKRAYDFLDKLINVTLPRVRDFSGISPKALDGRGNLTIGMNEHTVFPEVAGDDVSKLHGLQVCISTTAKNNEDALKLFRALKFPFKKS